MKVYYSYRLFDIQIAALLYQVLPNVQPSMILWIDGQETISQGFLSLHTFAL